MKELSYKNGDVNRYANSFDVMPRTCKVANTEINKVVEEHQEPAPNQEPAPKKKKKTTKAVDSTKEEQ